MSTVDHIEALKANYAAVGVQAHCVSFIEDMAGAYEWADLVICRAGALTVAELAAAGVASILVPFPHAVDDHQTGNARFLVNVGGEWLLHDYGYGKVGPGYFNRAVDYFSNDTAGHNCLVIGGRNQRKDDQSQGTITDVSRPPE
mgnify:CR=1 FL=1